MTLPLDMDFGVDVASYQGYPIDWRKAAAPDALGGSNIKLAYIKWTQGQRGDYENPIDDAQRDGAAGAGIPVGGYHYAEADDPPEAQADYFWSELANSDMVRPGVRLAPALDMEEGAMSSYAADFTARWLERMRANGATRMGVYASRYWWTNFMHPERWLQPDTFLWIAEYNGQPGQPTWSHPQLALHQHTSSGVVAGFSANVDRNCTMQGWHVPDLLIPAIHVKEADMIFESIALEHGTGKHHVSYAVECGSSSQIVADMYIGLTTGYGPLKNVELVLPMYDGNYGAPEAGNKLDPNNGRPLMQIPLLGSDKDADDHVWWKLPSGCVAVSLNYECPNDDVRPSLRISGTPFA